MATEQQEAMDAAAREAKAELDEWDLERHTAADLLKWHQKWYMKAGHKRVGKILAQAGKQSNA